MNNMRNEGVMKRLMISIFVLFVILSVSVVGFPGDVPRETGIVQEVGDNFVLVVIRNGNGFKDGTKLAFYLHKKTKIIMAKSRTPLTLSSLLVGDTVEIILGPVETNKDGKVTRYADRIIVQGKKRGLQPQKVKGRRKG
jgi:hypothetical protein